MSSEVKPLRGRPPPNFRILMLVFMMMASGVLAFVALIILRGTQAENADLAARLHRTGKRLRWAQPRGGTGGPPIKSVVDGGGNCAPHPSCLASEHLLLACPLPAEKGKETLAAAIKVASGHLKEATAKVGAGWAHARPPARRALPPAPCRAAAG